MDRVRNQPAGARRRRIAVSATLALALIAGLSVFAGYPLGVAPVSAQQASPVPSATATEAAEATPLPAPSGAYM